MDEAGTSAIIEAMLSHEEAGRVYDRIGSFQDWQGFYEDPATEQLLRHADFGSARAVFEFGCGTGRFASRLLSELLSASATYRGVDVSPRMVDLARRRLERWSARAEVVLTGGDPPSGEPSGSCDRFVSSYVFDLLAEDEIRTVLREAHRMLRPGGRLCLVSLTTGTGPVSRAVTRAWSWIQERRASLVGGCRPIELLDFVSEPDWKLLFHEKVVAFAVTSEVSIAQPR